VAPYAIDDRFLGTHVVPISKLRLYPGNPRQGNLAVIKKSLAKHSQYKTIVVQADDPEHPENGGTVLGGNHTLMAAKELGWDTLRVDVWDVTDEQARAIVLIDNRSGDLAEYDDRLLAELLAQVEDLDGTGYDPYDVDQLATKLAEQADDDVTYTDASGDDITPPDATEHACPSCGHAWRGACEARATQDGVKG
jgi:hypothetical protein